MTTYKTIVIAGLMFAGSELTAQELPGLSYCLLFDSKLEKEAFQLNQSKNVDPLLFLLAYDFTIDSVQYAKVKSELSTYAAKLQAKREGFKSERSFAQAVFFRIHSRYLTNYQPAVPFNSIFKGGLYNCVSATGLYAYLLGEFGYSPAIIKTRYHSFIMMTLSDSCQVLLETTDRRGGFVYKKNKIAEKLDGYLANEREMLARQATLSAPFNQAVSFQRMTLKELAGLHYYNLAVELMNAENYFDAFRMLRKARILYPDSDCINDFLAFSSSKYESELSEAFNDR